MNHHDHNETYRAIADHGAAARLAQTSSPFTIEVRFMGGLSDGQKAAFKLAAHRWTTIIVGDLPSVMVGGEVIDDLLILAQGAVIDGPGNILGQAGPTKLRPAKAGAAAYLPAKGVMSFDTADLAEMEKNGTLADVITHEMGHVLGVGTIWTHKGMIKGAGTSNPTFRGTHAMAEYGRLRGGGAAPVPVENQGGLGTRDAHWRETVFRSELMTGYVGAAGNPLSRLTVASLMDLGYTVDLEAAEAYGLPNLMALAEAGSLVAAPPHGHSGMLTNIPIVLPEDSLQ